jgi:hypothetical protein
MVTVDEAFEEWLSEPFANQKTREEQAIEEGTAIFNLRWAFSAGYVIGQQQAVKDTLDK